MQPKQLCGRPTKSGSPCGNTVTYSAPLEAFAPACLLHMSKIERQDYDAEPLWSSEGQVLWFLQDISENEDADLADIKTIASEVMLSESTVRATLLKLEDKGDVCRQCYEGRDCWGLSEQYWQQNGPSYEEQDETSWIAATNAELHKVKQDLQVLFSGHSIVVNSLSDIAPGLFHTERVDQIMIQTSNPTEAAWLYSRLAEDGTT